MAQDLRMHAAFQASMPEDVVNRVDVIAQLDLERQKSAALDDGADPELVKRSERELRRFLALPLLFPDAERAFSPTIPVDQLWHELILESVKYVEFCEAVYGRYLHHVPREAAADDQDVELADYEYTMDRLREAFEEVDEEVWRVRGLRCRPCMNHGWTGVRLDQSGG